jgi:hypothetical protein
MGASTCAPTVQHVRLRPARIEDAAQMLFAVEDALNTADFGDCGRLIVVRRLRLRAVPPRAGTALVARALDAAWREVAVRSVPASHPHASDAESVHFASRTAARLAWLALAAAGANTRAWYWAAALPELGRSAPAGDARTAMHGVVAALLREGATELTQALRGWSDDATAVVAQALPEAINRRLAGLLTAAPHVRVAADPEAGPQRGLTAGWQPVAGRLARQEPTSEAAATWLAPLLGQVPTLAQTKTVLGFGMPLASGLPRPAGTTNAVPAGDGSGAAGRGRAGATQRPRALAWPWLADAAETQQGGLLCLVNVLASLGFERWLERQAAQAARPFVDALFTQLLDAGTEAPADPQRAWFAQSTTDAATLAGSDFIEADAGLASSHALRLWRARLRRALRRRAGIDLHDVLRRQAWVSGTSAHLDVVFPLAEVDLRLRRHGLDSDPGWVPWFGRIVAFHFVGAEHLPPRR